MLLSSTSSTRVMYCAMSALYERHFAIADLVSASMSNAASLSAEREAEDDEPGCAAAAAGGAFAAGSHCGSHCGSQCASQYCRIRWYWRGWWL